MAVFAGFWWESLKEGECLEDLDVNGWIILELALRK